MSRCVRVLTFPKGNAIRWTKQAFNFCIKVGKVTAMPTSQARARTHASCKRDQLTLNKYMLFKNVTRLLTNNNRWLIRMTPHQPTSLKTRWRSSWKECKEMSWIQVKCHKIITQKLNMMKPIVETLSNRKERFHRRMAIKLAFSLWRDGTTLF